MCRSVEACTAQGIEPEELVVKTVAWFKEHMTPSEVLLLLVTVLLFTSWYYLASYYWYHQGYSYYWLLCCCIPHTTTPHPTDITILTSRQTYPSTQKNVFYIMNRIDKVCSTRGREKRREEGDNQVKSKHQTNQQFSVAAECFVMRWIVCCVQQN